MPHNIFPIPAFNDNYIWAIVHPNKKTVIVDPGQAQPVVDFLQSQQLQLAAILLTHHHFDHTGGVEELREHYTVPVYAPAHDQITLATHFLQDNAQVTIPEVDLELNVLDIGGHTKGHIGYVGHNWLFCGDTLFAGGCGRVFEGTAQQMYDSLQRLSQLAPKTVVYCAHEYTANNLAFAQLVEPSNTAINERLTTVKQQRADDQVTLPSTIALEHATNPFLRCHVEPVQKAAAQHAGKPLKTEVEVFAALRAWKDNF